MEKSLVGHAGHGLSRLPPSSLLGKDPVIWTIGWRPSVGVQDAPGGCELSKQNEPNRVRGCVRQHHWQVAAIVGEGVGALKYRPFSSFVLGVQLTDCCHVCFALLSGSRARLHPAAVFQSVCRRQLLGVTSYLA